MRVFSADPDDDWSSRHAYDVDATHRWSLPGVRCDACGATWSSTGVQYPSIARPAGAAARAYGDPWPVSVPEFLKLQAPLRDSYPGLPFAPGTQLGPLAGRASGEMADFPWSNPWTFLIRCDALQRLSEFGCRGLKAYPTDLKPRRRDALEILELELPPTASLAAETLPLEARVSCPTCSRRAIQAPHEVVLDPATIPVDADVFRGSDLTTYIYVTERFVEAVRTLGLANIAFVEVRLP
jgi:uncharacterized double-CXXCG motif protein